MFTSFSANKYLTVYPLKFNYTNSTALRKRKIISSIIPEKFSFDESGYRTPKVNEAAQLIYQINNELRLDKNRKSDYKNHPSCVVVPARIELTSKV